MNIKDIAALAKVSTSTVSKILNNKDEDISSDTRKKVLKVIKECQYVPYAKVRDSTIQKTGMIGVVLSKIYSESTMLACYIEECAKKNGYSILVSYTDEDEGSEEKAIQILGNKNVEGIILLSAPERTEQLIEQIEAEKLPYVILKNQTNMLAPTIVYGEEQASYIAAKILIEKGHRNIGCILSTTKTNIRGQWIEGYAKALYEKDILVENEKIYIADTASVAGEIGTKKLLSTNVTAIICANNEIACRVYSVLQGEHIQIPREISVISTEDSQISCCLNPALTAVQVPYQGIAEDAALLLIEWIEGKKNPGSPIRYKDVQLKERESLAQPPQGKSGLGKKIIVVGSMNMDITIKVPTLPSNGETVLANGTYTNPGGKGANQAVGAGKLGGYVYAIGRLGSDNDGKEIYGNLIKSSVKTDGIIFDTENVSGKAYINVAQSGESTIVVYPGANQNLDTRQIKKFKYLFEDAQFCLLSSEIPSETAEYTISLCTRKKVEVILKPAAVDKINPEWLNQIAYFIPNEKEINLLAPDQVTIEEKAQYFFERGVKNVIVTLGKRGCYLKNAQYSVHIPSANFTPVDTTGGADSFISALAVYLSEGNNLVEAIAFATYSAGISITRQGVQPALPDRITLDIYQEEIRTLMQKSM